MNAPDALVLDFGGVISRTLFETHRGTERALRLEANALTWMGPFDPDTDSLWVAMQDGQLSEREYWAQRTREIGRLVGEDWTEMAQFVKAARGADPESVIRPEALDAIRTAKARGARLGVLSNELDLFYGPEFRGKLPFLKDFDTIIDATYTKILKPDPAAYLSCADELGVPPASCVFVDDQPRNISGADEAGMRTVLFDVRQPRASFEQALKLIRDSRQETRRA